MKKKVFLILMVILNLHFSFSQTKSEIDSLLNQISRIKDSKEITKTEQAQKIIAFDESSLIILSDLFDDTTPTAIESECLTRNLTKGEVAIILADRIEGMPYGTLTGVQNCLLTFCKGNLNLIEYYLDFIEVKGILTFKEKYVNWLDSDDRIEWRPLIDYKSSKERKREIRKRKRAKRKSERLTD